jgi:hypothetical protein
MGSRALAGGANIVIETTYGSHDDTRRRPTTIHDDIPILPDSQIDIPAPNLIRYQIADGAGGAIHFYQIKMPENDWLTSQSHLIRPNLAVLSYHKNGKRATIIIHQDEAVCTRIMITIARQD